MLEAAEWGRRLGRRVAASEEGGFREGRTTVGGKEAGELHAWPPAGEEAGTRATHHPIWISHGGEQICGVERETDKERERGRERDKAGEVGAVQVLFETCTAA